MTGCYRWCWYHQQSAESNWCYNHDQKQLGEERDYFTLQFTVSPSINQGSQHRALEQELKQRPRRSTAYWLAPRELLSLFSYDSQNHQPKGSRDHREVDPPTLINNVYNRFVHKPIWWEHLLNWGPSSQVTPAVSSWHKLIRTVKVASLHCSSTKITETKNMGIFNYSLYMHTTCMQLYHDFYMFWKQKNHFSKKREKKNHRPNSSRAKTYLFIQIHRLSSTSIHLNASPEPLEEKKIFKLNLNLPQQRNYCTVKAD